MKFVLIVLVYAGPLAQGDSVSFQAAEFNSEAACRKAATALKTWVLATTKIVRADCFPKGEE